MLQSGFIYKWTNLKTNKKYIGSHIGHINDRYVGSGKYFKNAYNKDPNSFERSLLYDILSANVHDEIVEL